MRSFIAQVTAVIFGGLFLVNLATAADGMVVMNYQAVLFNSAAAEEASVELRDRLQPAQARVQELETALQARQSRLQTDADILTEQEINGFQQEMQAMAAERQQLAARIQQEQRASQNAFAQEYQPLIREIVSNYVEENDIGVILEAQAIVWNTSLPDITEDITALFDEQYNSSN